MKLDYLLYAASAVVIAGSGAHFAAKRTVPEVKEAVAMKGTAASYDWEASRRKLEQMGVALQHARAEGTVLPVNQRTRMEHTGVPSGFACMRQGRSWSLPAMFAPSTRQKLPTSGARTNYWALQPDMQFDWTPTEFAQCLQDRGEALPVIIDANMHSSADLDNNSELPFLVLRLNGDVDVVYARPWDWKTLIKEK